MLLRTIFIIGNVYLYIHTYKTAKIKYVKQTYFTLQFNNFSKKIHRISSYCFLIPCSLMQVVNHLNSSSYQLFHLKFHLWYRSNFCQQYSILKYILVTDKSIFNNFASKLHMSIVLLDISLVISEVTFPKLALKYEASEDINVRLFQYARVQPLKSLINQIN